MLPRRDLLLGAASLLALPRPTRRLNTTLGIGDTIHVDFHDASIETLTGIPAKLLMDPPAPKDCGLKFVIGPHEARISLPFLEGAEATIRLHDGGYAFLSAVALSQAGRGFISFFPDDLVPFLAHGEGDFWVVRPGAPIPRAFDSNAAVQLTLFGAWKGFTDGNEEFQRIDHDTSRDNLWLAAFTDAHPPVTLVTGFGRR